MALGLFRYQMPHLAKTIHMDEVVYGRVATALSLAITLAFFATARWTGWHGKTRWIFIPQIVLIAVAVLMTWTTGAWVMAALMLAGGLSAGMLYTNRVFYGSLGAAPAVRTRRMAIHEISLNVGIITGSYLGNLLSQHLGPSRVYPYLAAAIAAIALSQALTWSLLMRRYARKLLPAMSAGGKGGYATL
jgi:predicted MFS family arabinose efflux permease